MGKTSKWIRSFLTGKKERSKEKTNESEFGLISTIPGTPKEKRRWSFRRSSATGPPPPISASTVKDSSPPPQPLFSAATADNEDEENKNASTAEISVAIEEIAAVKIQACFRSHLVNKKKSESNFCFFKLVLKN